MVTALFCDVTGSTSLGEELDPEVLRGVLNSYFLEIRGIIERHGGTVEKFIGDAVMAVFGIPRAHEDDGLRAVRAAAEIRERLPAIACEVGVALQFRTGVNTGPVLSGEGENLAVGDAVNVAARLEQAAEPGEIVLGEETLALVRDAVKVEALDPLELKGKSEPVLAFRLLSVDPEAPGFTRHLDVPLVGRADELRVLRHAWERVVSESGCHLFTLMGEAGVGKSRLVAEVLGALGEDATVLRGRCLHYGEGITFWPLVEALMPVGEVASPLLDQLSAESTAAAGELLWQVRRVLEELASQRPVLLHLDDVQWAEPTLLDLVEYVTDLSRSSPILLLCTARLELLEDRPGWGGGKVNAATLLLERLEAADAEILLEELGDGLDRDSRARVIQASDGNPLFLEEMVALARDRGRVETPPTIQALLTARLEGLAVEDRELLERGAVEGEVFHRLAVRAMADERLAAQVEPRLAGLVRKELIRPHPATLKHDDAFRFRHLLIRDAAYDGLPKSTRAELHERFARWLEQNASELLELDEIAGWHLEQAVRYRQELGRAVDAELTSRAAMHLRMSGERAFARADMSAAANLIGRALDLLPEGACARPMLMLDLASALVELGDVTRALETFERALTQAQAMGFERAEWRARVGRAYVHMFMAGSFREACLTAEEAIGALSALGDELGVARAWNVVGFARLQEGKMRDAEVALKNAVEHAGRAKNTREAAQAVTWLVISTWLGPKPVDDGLALCREVLAEPVTRQVEAFALIEHAPLLAMKGEFQQAREFYRRGKAILEELGLGLYAAGVSQEYCDLELLAGDLAAAEAELRRACEELEGLGEKGFLSTRAACLAHVLCLQGRYEEADPFVQLAIDTGVEDDVITNVLSRTARARVAVGRGKPEEAVILAQEAVVILESTEWISARGDALVVLAEALQSGRRFRDAALVLKQALQLYEQKGNSVAAAGIGDRLSELQSRVG